ncbi:hypothetical protein [Simkania sp.]|uniref:hypothetical protein n=1 Tax=Simkania sp. TaxID=34094 RepID=UPI003B530598
MAVQQFQYVRYTTQYLFNHCGIEAREPFVPNDHLYALPPFQEIEIQVPNGSALTDDSVRNLVNRWVDVFEAQGRYMNMWFAYIRVVAPVNVLSCDPVDMSTNLGVRLKQVWTDYIAVKEMWKTYQNQGFSIRRTQ